MAILASNHGAMTRQGINAVSLVPRYVPIAMRIIQRLRLSTGSLKKYNVAPSKAAHAMSLWEVVNCKKTGGKAIHADPRAVANGRWVPRRRAHAMISKQANNPYGHCELSSNRLSR